MAERLATNAEIRAKEVRLIGPEGKQLGIVPLKIAIDAARAVDLDLVEVAPNASPPVAKVMDYGKFLYEQERAARDARKKQKAATGQKAIRFRPKTDDHDIATKVRQSRRFLTQGYSVRFQVMFRMRELRRPELGMAIFDRLEKDLVDVGQIESRSGLQGRFATMVMAPRPGVVRLREPEKPPTAAAVDDDAPGLDDALGDHDLGDEDLDDDEGGEDEDAEDDDNDEDAEDDENGEDQDAADDEAAGGAAAGSVGAA